MNKAVALGTTRALFAVFNNVSTNIVGQTNTQLIFSRNNFIDNLN